LHNSLLKTACKDYGLTKSKKELTKICKRATPDEWAKFATASKVSKIKKDEQAKHVFNLLQKYFSLSKVSGVMVNSLMDQKLQKGTNPCKTNWRLT